MTSFSARDDASMHGGAKKARTTLISKHDRSRLESMGSMLDSDDGENHRENRRPLQQQKRRPSSSKLGHGSDKNPVLQQRNNNENAPNSTRPNLAQDMTQSMIRQHRRRLMASGHVAASILTPHNAGALAEQPAWDGFVRKGTQLKSFLDEALQHVATGYAITNGSGTKRQRLLEDEEADNEGSRPQHIKEREEATAMVAREKTKEVLVLQQKLEEAQSQVAALTASNHTLREDSTASSLRFERTMEALKIAAASAACARTDADQAEVSAECLATQLEALKTVVEQTKQAAQVLHEEQQEISEEARSGQAKLLKVEAELARSIKETKNLKEKANEWETKAKELQEESTIVKRQLADETEKSRKLAQTLEERDSLEEARQQRSQQVEKELQEAQALLVEASSAAADSDALANLNETTTKLQEANKKLHEQLSEQQDTAREDRERLRESLLVAEQEAQTLRIEASLKSDKDAGLQQSTSKSAEKSAVTPNSSLEDVDTSYSISTTLNQTSTPRSSVGKDNHVVPPATTCSICSICFKAESGMMKWCQCGRPECDKRAHVICANRIPPGPSVSHPGTPAAKLPIVLCAGALAGIMNKN